MLELVAALVEKGFLLLLQAQDGVDQWPVDLDVPSLPKTIAAQVLRSVRMPPARFKMTIGRRKT